VAGGRGRPPRALSLSLGRVHAHAFARERIDAHLPDLALHLGFHVARRKRFVELASAKQRQRVGARRDLGIDPQDSFHEFGIGVVPRGLCIAQELLALAAQL
jgi:hypothetical protein